LFSSLGSRTKTVDLEVLGRKRREPHVRANIRSVRGDEETLKPEPDALGETHNSASAPPRARPSDRPERVGRYIVIERLGAGAMGAVYAAYDPELDRKVAIKLLLPGTGGGDAQARLVREAHAMAQVSHPNVLPVHDVGTWEGQVFVAMELVRGETLRARLEREPHRWLTHEPARVLGRDAQARGDVAGREVLSHSTPAWGDTRERPQRVVEFRDLVKSGILSGSFCGSLIRNFARSRSTQEFVGLRVDLRDLGLLQRIIRGSGVPGGAGSKIR